MDYLSADGDFALLALRDLLDAREHFHTHLIHKRNVIGTAIGRYLIRKTDPYPTREAPGLKPAVTSTEVKRPRGERTLENSEVRSYSWPCVLVFLSEWVDVHSGRLAPEDVVPPAIYMPDGRVVPICLVRAPLDDKRPEQVRDFAFPENYIGGGYPVVVDVQGEEHIASIACMVSDGHTAYALTNRHVAGEPGEAVYSVLSGRKTLIGHSSPKQLTRLPFETVFPSWPGKHVYAHLDVGLIEVVDKTRWTAQVFGLGTLGPLADLSPTNFSLKVVGCPVRAFGCASGEMYGSIFALFYRFKSVGGFEYVADFLIGPRAAKEGEKPLPFGTHPGDSGTLWVLDGGKPDDGANKRPSRPLAVQWGGQAFLENGKTARQPYVLATTLSTICSVLEVDVVSDWNTGLPDYWGAVGHYSIAERAILFAPGGPLKELMTANLDRISFEEHLLNKKNLTGLSNGDFVPLADVPDLVWKRGDFSRGGPEHPNHFADIDLPNADGKTMLDLCKDDKDNVSVKTWQKYYTDVEDEGRGLLPFRAWQFYDKMVEFAGNGQAAEFVCAAGILSHYVGDACQPLHISHMHDGDPSDTVPGEIRDRRTGEVTEGQVPRGKGVHTAYENGMVDYHVTEILAGLKEVANRVVTKAHLITGGRAAAVAVVELMQRTYETIPPKEIVDAYVALKEEGLKPKPIADALWEAFGDRTIKIMADGCWTLALLWASAWAEGQAIAKAAGTAGVTKLDAIPTEKLAALYKDPQFLPSVTLDRIAKVLK